MRDGAAEAVIKPVDTGSSTWAAGALAGRAAMASAGNGAATGAGLLAAAGVAATGGAPASDARAAGGGGAPATGEATDKGVTDNGVTADNAGSATIVDSGGATAAGASGWAIGTIAGAGASLIGESRMRGGAAMFTNARQSENTAGSARKQAFAEGKNSHAPPARAYAFSPLRSAPCARRQPARRSAPDWPGPFVPLLPDLRPPPQRALLPASAQRGLAAESQSATSSPSTPAPSFAVSPSSRFSLPSARPRSPSRRHPMRRT